MSLQVSVVMPVRDAEDSVISACLSILQQSFTDLELLVVDDGSRDATRDRLHELRDPRLRVIENTGPRGISGALNCGVGHAFGQYIARMDADDVSYSDRLQLQYSYLQTHVDVDVCGTAMRQTDGRIRQYPEADQAIKARMVFENAIAHPTVMMRKSIFDQFQAAYDTTLDVAQDYAFWVKNLESLNFANLADILHVYQVDSSSDFFVRRQARRREAARRIRQVLLARLALDPTREELSLHHAVAELRFPFLLERARDVAEWLMRLKHANRYNAVFEETAFENVLAERYFTIAYGVTLHRWQAYSEYVGAGAGLLEGVDTQQRVVARLRQSWQILKQFRSGALRAGR